MNDLPDDVICSVFLLVNLKGVDIFKYGFLFHGYFWLVKILFVSTHKLLRFLKNKIIVNERP